MAQKWRGVRRNTVRAGERRFTLRLPEGRHERLLKIAAERELSLNALLNSIIRDFLREGKQ